MVGAKGGSQRWEPWWEPLGAQELVEALVTRHGPQSSEAWGVGQDGWFYAFGSHLAAMWIDATAFATKKSASYASELLLCTASVATDDAKIENAVRYLYVYIFIGVTPVTPCCLQPPMLVQHVWTTNLRQHPYDHPGHRAGLVKPCSGGDLTQWI